MYDNTNEGDTFTGAVPQPTLILHLDHGRVMDVCDLRRAPHWAKPILATAVTLADTGRSAEPSP